MTTKNTKTTTTKPLRFWHYVNSFALERACVCVGMQNKKTEVLLPFTFVLFDLHLLFYMRALPLPLSFKYPSQKHRTLPSLFLVIRFLLVYVFN
jgi:hypothetical protein